MSPTRSKMALLVLGAPTTAAVVEKFAETLNTH
jgi:hypothetical protein